MSDVNLVDNLVEDYLKKSQFKHKLFSKKDYITTPSKSGYRGVHLIYDYHSKRNKYYNDLKIEIQIRSLLQHAWATTVETIDIFTKQALKSSQGDKDWSRFFVLMSSAMAIKEQRPISLNTPADLVGLKNEIIEYENKLGVKNKLNAFRVSMRLLDSLDNNSNQNIQDAHYYLLELDTTKNIVKIITFNQNESIKANEAYIELEKASDISINVVLVSAESLSTLKLAYPNYYADTDMFLTSLNEIIT